jgi:hypothetical protein
MMILPATTTIINKARTLGNLLLLVVLLLRAISHCCQTPDHLLIFVHAHSRVFLLLDYLELRSKYFGDDDERRLTPRLSLLIHSSIHPSVIVVKKNKQG